VPTHAAPPGTSAAERNWLVLCYHTETSMGSTHCCGKPSYILIHKQLLTAASACENETHQVQCYSPPAAVTWVVLWCRLAPPPSWLKTAAVGELLLLLSAAWIAPAPSCPWMLGRPAATSDSRSCRRASNENSCAQRGHVGSSSRHTLQLAHTVSNR
jgi:hypothetical protein